MTNSPTASSAFAVALLGSLIESGVRDVVVCPGSRSQALALAAAEAERAGAIRLHVRTDERSAGFFALGIARETGVPAPVIVTSGGAVANLMPAAVEAHEGRVAMVLLTADRPAVLRGSRSNQTTRQTGLFGDFSRLSLDIDVEAVAGAEPGAGAGATEPAEATEREPAEGREQGDRDIATVVRRVMQAAGGSVAGPPAGPVQLNLQFTEPLSGWPEGATLDFGLGPMAPLELFAAVGERRDAAARDAATRDAAAHDAATQTHQTGRSRRSDQPAQQPIVRETADGYHTFLPSESDIYVHDGDRLAVVIAGEGAGDEAEQFAHASGLPLLAEVVSGARFGPQAIATYATLIDEPDIGGLIERAIVFGHPTLTRQVPALLARSDVEVIIVDPHVGEGVDHYGVTNTHAEPRGPRVVRGASVAEGYDPKSMHRWLGAWVVADRELRERLTTVHAPDLKAARETGYKERNAYARAEVAVKREPIERDLLVESVWRATWPHDRLVLAASRLVRVLDGLAAPRRVEVRSNRGLAGIDGTVATALGIGVASQQGESARQRAGATRVLLGDLALLHDAGSLLIPEGEERPRVQLFVGNDGGGTIFDTLEAAQSAAAWAFDRVMYTPQQAKIEALAAAYGWKHRLISTRGELEVLLTEPVTGPEIIEVPLAR